MIRRVLRTAALAAIAPAFVVLAACSKAPGKAEATVEAVVAWLDGLLGLEQAAVGREREDVVVADVYDHEIALRVEAHGVGAFEHPGTLAP